MNHDVGRAVNNDTDEDREAVTVDKNHQAAAKFFMLTKMTDEAE